VLVNVDEENAMKSLFITMSLLIGSFGYAQSRELAPLGCPAPGIIFIKSTGEGITFLGASGDFCTHRSNRSGATVVRHGLLMMTGSPYSDLAGPKVAKLWPLVVGKTVEFQYELQPARKQTFTQIYTVEGREVVTTQAGTFNTFVIRHDTVGLTRETRYAALEMFYYSPEIQDIVRYTFATLERHTPAQYSGESYDIVEIIPPK
jgi:hypothetical protein